MAYGPHKNDFKGEMYKQHYDYTTDIYGEEMLILDNITDMSLNNSIGFKSSLKFSTKPAMNGQIMKFSVFVTQE